MCKIIRSRVASQPSLALERDKSPLRGAGGLLNLSHSASEAANLKPKRWNLGLGFRAYERVAALLNFFDGFPVLETHALETHLRKCILLIVLSFAKGPSRPVFVGHCFQRHSGSREQILFLIFLSFAFPCFGNHLRKCILLIVLGFAKGPSQPIFVGHCFQRHSGSREQIVNGDKLRVKGNPCLVPFYPPSSDQVVGAK